MQPCIVFKQEELRKTRSAPASEARGPRGPVAQSSSSETGNDIPEVCESVFGRGRLVGWGCVCVYACIRKVFSVDVCKRRVGDQDPGFLIDTPYTRLLPKQMGTGPLCMVVGYPHADLQLVPTTAVPSLLRSSVGSGFKTKTIRTVLFRPQSSSHSPCLPHFLPSNTLIVIDAVYPLSPSIPWDGPRLLLAPRFFSSAPAGDR